MHKCLKCGKEFEGNFCPECGTKWVDPELCPKCGTRHEPDAKFCPECGAKLNGNVKVKEIAVTSSEEKKGKIKSYIALGGVICILLAALMGLVFIFCTGVMGVAVSDGYKVKDTNMLYYYFGDAYKAIDDTKQSLLLKFDWIEIGTAREFALYLPAVIGTVVSALGILGVICLSALTAYRTYKKYYKKEEANVIAPAVATYLVFASAATILLALSACNITYTSTDLTSGYFDMDDVSMKTAFSDPTLAGLITGGVFLGIGVLLLAGCNYKAFKSFDAKTGAVSAVAVSALIVVVVALLSLPAVGLRAGILGVEEQYSMMLGTQLGLDQIEDDETIAQIIAFASIGGISGVALAVVSMVTLFKKIPAAYEGKKKSNLILCIAIVLLAAIYLTFAILANSTYIDALLDINEVPDSYIEKVKSLIKSDYTVPIALLVMAVLALVAELAGKFVRKKEEPVETAEQISE